MTHATLVRPLAGIVDKCQHCGEHRLLAIVHTCRNPLCCGAGLCAECLSDLGYEPAETDEERDARQAAIYVDTLYGDDTAPMPVLPALDSDEFGFVPLEELGLPSSEVTR